MCFTNANLGLLQSLFLFYLSLSQLFYFFTSSKVVSKHKVIY